MDLKSTIKQLSEQVGFLACGISKARKLDEEEQHLKQWLEQGFHGKMAYMENHFEKRLDPTLLVPGGKSVISFLFNYFPKKTQDPGAPKIAKYAYGDDYHHVIKEKLRLLTEGIIEANGPFQFRSFVDSAPVMERQWAALSGLGWIGKNSLLLRQGVGSFFFIANIICDLELEPDGPVTDHCGTCTACIDACPTQAILPNSVIDASRCISYLTIELKDPIPAAFEGKTEGWAFGCDICQDVCPWNRFSTENTEARFEPAYDWTQWNSGKWDELTEEEFETVFERSPIQRAGYRKLRENIRFLG